MPELEFDGQTITVNHDTPYLGGNRSDWSVAITDYELRQVASTLPPGKTLPVALRSGSADPGDMVLVPSAHGDIPALVALARMRDCRSGPHYPEGGFGAQEAAQPQDEPIPAPGRNARLERLVDDFQDVLERFMVRMEVDPDKYDHQNQAGDLVALLLAVLRRHDYLPEPVSVMDGPAPSLRSALRDGYLTKRDAVERAVTRGLQAMPANIASVMRELDEVLG